MTRRHIAAAVAFGTLTVLLAACGSTTTQTTTPTGVTTTQSPNPSASAPVASSSPSTPAPAATESLPTGDIPDNQAYVAYQGASGKYLVNVPEGWARSAAGTSATFTDKLNTVQVVQAASAAAPTVTSVSATVVPGLKASASQFQLLKVAPFTRTGGSGIHITYLADSHPDPVTGKVVRDASESYLFWKNGMLVTVTLTGPQTADNVDPWAKVSGSFRWTP